MNRLLSLAKLALRSVDPLQKMAKIHDDPDNPRVVYRVQNSALRKAIPHYIQQSLTHSDPAVRAAGEASLKRLQERERAQRMQAPAVPGNVESFFNSSLTHGSDKRDMHEVGCNDARCPGGGFECKTDGLAPPAGVSRHREYSDFLPDELRSKGYKLILTHHQGWVYPGDKRSKYESLHGTLIGPGLSQDPYSSHFEAEKQPGVWHHERRISSFGEDVGSWPSESAWDKFGYSQPPDLRSGENKRLATFLKSVDPHVTRAMEDFARNHTGAAYAGDAPERYYAHAPRMLRFFKKKGR